jgi:hypothetical protein
MKSKQPTLAMPLHDYQPALQGALSWLGDRHLLAEPVPRLSEDRGSNLADSRRWHPAVIAAALEETTRLEDANS